MRELSLSPAASSTAFTARPYELLDLQPVADRVARVTSEGDGLWLLTEKLSALARHPVAALELVARTAGELTRADAAAVVLHAKNELVLASRWGLVGIPLGHKSAELRRVLDTAWPTIASMPIHSGAHEIGSLWIGRFTGVFDANEQRVLRTLASVTSFTLPKLVRGWDAPAVANTEEEIVHTRARLG